MRKYKPAFPELEKQILAKGLLKKQIADILEIEQGSLSRKLTGRTEFTLKEIYCLHKLFPNVSIEELFEIDG